MSRRRGPLKMGHRRAIGAALRRRHHINRTVREYRAGMSRAEKFTANHDARTASDPITPPDTGTEGAPDVRIQTT